MLINFDDNIPGSVNFKWREALYLPSLGVYHSPSDAEISAIISQAAKMDQARDLLGVPLVVDCWIRPTSVNDGGGKYMGVDYNALPNIGGAPSSAHITGSATDSKPRGMTVDAAQAILIPQLSTIKMSMENNGSVNGRDWLHLQDRAMADGTYRLFNP